MIRIRIRLLIKRGPLRFVSVCCHDLRDCQPPYLTHTSLDHYTPFKLHPTAATQVALNTHC